MCSYLCVCTTNYNCPGVEGEDVVGMLNKALTVVGVSNVKGGGHP